MIYANAETTEDIAQLLRIMDSEKNLTARKVADRLLGKSSIIGEGKGLIITAPRRSGKTTELLLFAEEKNPLGQFIVVCINHEVQITIINRHREIFESGNVAKRLTGAKIESLIVNPPLILTPETVKFMRGQGRPVYVDEFSGLPEGTQKDILDSGLFVAAVTSSRA